MKQILTIVITILLLFTSIPNKVNADTPAPPNVSGDGVVLMDATTGDILYGKNIDEAFPPASTTKIMTALLTLENCNLDDVVTISNDFTNRNFKLLDGNTLVLKNGEQLTVKDLLYGLLLRSANDSAVALAEHISGSVPEFAKLMNKRAKELGCTNASFQNPNGLYDKDHKVSAKDLALILKALATHPEFSQIATTVSYTMAPTNKTDPNITKRDRILTNENKLVNKNLPEYYAGIEGGKTGYTIQSLHSYVACATRNNHRLIVTILHSNDRTFFQDARSLFDYGFMNFDLKKMYSKGDVVTSFNENDGNKISLLASKDFYYVTNKNSDSLPTIKLNQESIDSLSNKSFEKGDTVSNAIVDLDGKKIGTLNLVSSTTYNSSSLKAIVAKDSKNNKITYAIGIFIILFLLNIYRLKRIAAAKKRRYRKYSGLK